MHNIVTKSGRTQDYFETIDTRSALHRVLQGEMNGHVQSIKGAQKQTGSYTSVSNEMARIIIERRTQRIKQLKAEALLLGIQLKE
ncbi:hypothetical protein [Vreelandella venusta]|uniref:hypothetical protein n=1 Tax=Vreelandella venusta TaxID=44935 RepID=UPI0011BF7831|nr:hypothetical protein [Halomonas venusta]